MIYGSYDPFSSLWSHHWVTQLSPGQSMCANLDFKCLGWTVLLAWCRNRESNWSCLALSPVRHALNHRFTPSITSANRWLTNCVSVLPPFRVERWFNRWRTVLLMGGRVTGLIPCSGINILGHFWLLFHPPFHLPITHPTASDDGFGASYSVLTSDSGIMA